MIYSEYEVDVDMLLLLRNEVLEHHDCIFYSLSALQSILLEMKESYHTESAVKPSVVSLKNVMDLMRIVSLPGQEVAIAEGSGLEGMTPNEETFLVNAVTAATAQAKDSNLKRKRALDIIDTVDDDDVEEDQQFDEDVSSPAKIKKITAAKQQQQHLKGLAALPVSQQLRRLACYRRVFSRCWLCLLSLPLSAPQTKVILKHLPEHVMHLLTRPILLADFLTHCYDSGSGPIAVLALQSLFTLIAQHNLDYPHFFLSLYNLCSVEIFSAKYRTTFFSLLSRSLQSTNLPAYVVAAFIKRLAYLALHSPSCNSRFCVAQITWLLRKHPQCITLLHSATHNNENQYFNNDESRDLEAAGGLQSSLWELLLLERHFLVAAADLAKTVRDPRSTDNGRNGLHTRVEEHLALTYADLLTEQLSQVATKAKKHKLQQQDIDDNVSRNSNMSNSRIALSHRIPQQLLQANSLVASCFGLLE
eukprot:CAMPEP_0170093788 /NCGR_PEP_ID=MMETSP0019_2-20121128/26745_1 /TAXON_ID=98059 /ORGANISM="Dinobryon sp., Strain UTEXLB2267" /LENGTH=473 /DNA_ID=CAMNT_0010314747 /DNA_START=335 /DNA_END=1759 /DNA_ORIENTATION=-